MDGKKQSFFQELRKLAAHLDHGINWCSNPEFDYQSQARCMNSLKAYAEEIQDKLVESKSIYEEQQTSLVKYESLFSLVDEVIDQQREILQTQEMYMEEYGYIPFEKSFPVKEEKKNTEAEEPDPEPELEPASIPEENVMATPKVFQNDGLFMSPGVWGKMPPMYTPDVRNSAYGESHWPESAVSSTKKNASIWCSPKKIRKNLQMEMNTEDQDIFNQCPRAPSLSSLQNLTLDIYQFPPTPKSVTKVRDQKPAELPLSKPKDYLDEELPQPPKLSTKIQSLLYRTTLKNKAKPPSEVPLSTRNTESDLNTPSPPLLHTTFSNFDELDSPDVVAKPVLSCRKPKKKEQMDYFTIPEPPELTGVYHFSTSNKENCKTKNNFL